jgi:hypothetical protein
MTRRLSLIALALALGLLGAGSASAATLDPIGAFTKPIYLTSDPGDPNRLFVVEREGQILQVKGDTVSEFADLRSVVRCCDGERGLLSIALAPDFDASGKLYVDYTGEEEPGEIHVAELRAAGSSAPLSSLRNILTIPHPNQSNHNGGQLQFGPDGLLYISTGDGGGIDDQEHNAQNLNSLLGKILRIDPRQSGLLPYTVPAGNPFSAATAPANTIWSYGLRNPYRFSFDRLTGAIAIGDVGQNAHEEVDYATRGASAGANYGWNCREGFFKGPFSDPGCAAGESGGAFTAPVFDYPHVDPEDGGAFGCAIIGGFVARDASLLSLYGRYVYADLCEGTIRSLNFGDPLGSDRSENLSVAEPVSFGEDSCGRLYVISGKGTIYRFTAANPQTCAPSPTETARAITYVGIRAQSRHVKRNSRVLLTAFVSPCGGRRGEPVKLLRNGRHIATRRLDRACTVHFRPRISRGARYRATISENEGSLAGSSRPLKLRIRHYASKPHRPA